MSETMKRLGGGGSYLASDRDEFELLNPPSSIKELYDFDGIVRKHSKERELRVTRKLRLTETQSFGLLPSSIPDIRTISAVIKPHLEYHLANNEGDRVAKIRRKNGCLIPEYTDDTSRVAVIGIHQDWKDYLTRKQS